MSYVQVLPGGGAMWTSETFSATTSTNADELDLSSCSEFAVSQIIAGSSVGGSIQVQQRMSISADWTAFGSPLTVQDNAIDKFNSTVRPFGHIRFDLSGVTGLDASNTLILTVRGYSVGGGIL